MPRRYIYMLLVFFFFSCKKDNDDIPTPVKTFNGKANFDGNVDAAVEAADGDILICGRTPDNIPFLAKVSVITGSPVWTRLYDTFNISHINDIAETPDGGLMVVGDKCWSGSATQCDMMLMRTDSVGNVTWLRTKDGMYAESNFQIIRTHDDNYVTACARRTTESDIFMIKTTLEGDTLWSHLYPHIGIETPRDLIELSDHSYLVSGILSGGGGNSPKVRAYFMKIAASGNRSWENVLGDVNRDTYAEASIETTDGADHLSVGSEHTGLLTYKRAIAMKLNTSGQLLWSKSYSEDTVTLAAYDLVNDGIGGFTFIGNTNNEISSGHADPWIVSVDANGDQLWQHRYAHGDNEFGNYIFRLTAGRYFVIGNNWEASKYFVLGTNAEGVIE